MRLFALIVLALAVPLFLFGGAYVLNAHLQNRAEYRALLDHGQHADATAMAREIVVQRGLSQNSMRFRYTTFYYVDYRFDAATGRSGTISLGDYLDGGSSEASLVPEVQRFRISTDKRTYEAASPGTRAEIVFLPESPEIVRLVDEAGEFRKAGLWGWSVLMFVMAALSGLFFWQFKTTGRTW